MELRDDKLVVRSVEQASSINYTSTRPDHPHIFNGKATENAQNGDMIDSESNDESISIRKMDNFFSVLHPHGKYRTKVDNLDVVSHHIEMYLSHIDRPTKAYMDDTHSNQRDIKDRNNTVFETNKFRAKGLENNLQLDYLPLDDLITSASDKLPTIEKSIESHPTKFTPYDDANRGVKRNRRGKKQTYTIKEYHNRRTASIPETIGSFSDLMAQVNPTLTSNANIYTKSDIRSKMTARPYKPRFSVGTRRKATAESQSLAENAEILRKNEEKIHKKLLKKLQKLKHKKQEDVRSLTIPPRIRNLLERLRVSLIAEKIRYLQESKEEYSSYDDFGELPNKHKTKYDILAAKIAQIKERNQQLKHRYSEQPTISTTNTRNKINPHYDDMSLSTKKPSLVFSEVKPTKWEPSKIFRNPVVTKPTKLVLKFDWPLTYKRPDLVAVDGDEPRSTTESSSNHAAVESEISDLDIPSSARVVHSSKTNLVRSRPNSSNLNLNSDIQETYTMINDTNKKHEMQNKEDDRYVNSFLCTLPPCIIDDTDDHFSVNEDIHTKKRISKSRPSKSTTDVLDGDSKKGVNLWTSDGNLTPQKISSDYEDPFNEQDNEEGPIYLDEYTNLGDILGDDYIIYDYDEPEVKSQEPYMHTSLSNEPETSFYDEREKFFIPSDKRKQPNTYIRHQHHEDISILNDDEKQEKTDKGDRMTHKQDIRKVINYIPHHIVLKTATQNGFSNSSEKSNDLRYQAKVKISNARNKTEESYPFFILNTSKKNYTTINGEGGKPVIREKNKVIGGNAQSNDSFHIYVSPQRILELNLKIPFDVFYKGNSDIHTASDSILFDSKYKVTPGANISSHENNMKTLAKNKNSTRSDLKPEINLDLNESNSVKPLRLEDKLLNHEYTYNTKEKYNESISTTNPSKNYNEMFTEHQLSTYKVSPAAISTLLLPSQDRNKNKNKEASNDLPLPTDFERKRKEGTLSFSGNKPPFPAFSNPYNGYNGYIRGKYKGTYGIYVTPMPPFPKDTPSIIQKELDYVSELEQNIKKFAYEPEVKEYSSINNYAYVTPMPPFPKDTPFGIQKELDHISELEQNIKKFSYEPEVGEYSSINNYAWYSDKNGTIWYTDRSRIRSNDNNSAENQLNGEIIQRPRTVPQLISRSGLSNANEYNADGNQPLTPYILVEKKSLPNEVGDSIFGEETRLSHTIKTLPENDSMSINRIFDKKAFSKRNSGPFSNEGDTENKVEKYTTTRSTVSKPRERNNTSNNDQKYSKLLVTIRFDQKDLENVGTPKNKSRDMKSSSHEGLVIDKSETNKINGTNEIIENDSSISTNNIQDDVEGEGASQNDTHVPKYNSKNEFVKDKDIENKTKNGMILIPWQKWKITDIEKNSTDKPSNTNSDNDVEAGIGTKLNHASLQDNSPDNLTSTVSTKILPTNKLNRGKGDSNKYLNQSKISANPLFFSDGHMNENSERGHETFTTIQDFPNQNTVKAQMGVYDGWIPLIPQLESNNNNPAIQWYTVKNKDMMSSEINSYRRIGVTNKEVPSFSSAFLTIPHPTEDNFEIDKNQPGLSLAFDGIWNNFKSVQTPQPVQLIKGNNQFE